MKALWPSVRKEALALAPLWVSCCLGAAAAPLWSAFRFDVVALMAYIVGAVALGAHALGHEYGHRTLGALLAQPVRRSTILAIKLGVLAVALVSLTAVAWAGPYSPIKQFPSRAALDSRVLFLPTLMGLTLAPYLALVARSTLGGAVFTITVPGLLLIATDLLGTWLFGPSHAGEIDRFKYAAFAQATVAACVFAAIAIWRGFMRLEVTGDDTGHVSVSLSGPADTTRRSARSPYWLLAAKELHLQQMTFVIVALYICGWAAAMWTQRSPDTSLNSPWSQLDTLYAVLLSLLIGSLASAEERHLGTVEWQVLLPLASWKQFAVKAAVACGLVLVAGIGLPVGLAQFAPLPHLAGFPRGALWMVCVLALTTAMGSLYVSTLSSSGVRAVAAALPVMTGAFILMRSVELTLWWGVRAGLIPRRLGHWGPGSDAQAQWLLAGLAACVVAMFLVHAFRNHGAVDRGARRITAQAAVIGGTIVAAGVAQFLQGLR